MRKDIEAAIEKVEDARQRAILTYNYARQTALADGKYTLYAKGQIEEREQAILKTKADAYDVILDTLRSIQLIDAEDLNTLAILAYDFGVSGDREAGDLSRAIDLLITLKRLSFLFSEWEDNDIGKNIVSLRDELEQFENEV